MSNEFKFPDNFTTDELAEYRKIKRQQGAEDYARKRTEFAEKLNTWLLLMFPFDPIVASCVLVEFAIMFFTMEGIKEEVVRCIIDNDIENAKKCQDFFNHNYGKDED